METWKHLRAILLLPYTVTVVVPGVIMWLPGPDTLGLWESAPATYERNVEMASPVDTVEERVHFFGGVTRLDG
jgi:hypothetical protein